ncbi:MAG TPA: STAS domain-containing protein [Solirubrobacterales bacterium]|nr:STAS domain-containing protein [Solirubrobacterales bacterium]
MSTLDVTTERVADQTRVVLVGELDIANAPLLESELERVEADSPGTVVLDLSGVEFIDSTGLRSVIAANERAQAAGGRLVVVRGSAAVERLFSVMQVDQRLEIVDDPDAIAS